MQGKQTWPAISIKRSCGLMPKTVLPQPKRQLRQVLPWLCLLLLLCLLHLLLACLLRVPSLLLTRLCSCSGSCDDHKSRRQRCDHPQLIAYPACSSAQHGAYGVCRPLRPTRRFRSPAQNRRQSNQQTCRAVTQCGTPRPYRIVANQ